ncbi:Uncharacterised protein [Vibrio cholerae]|nr:Uncharacterised protein [Vibrio cholerae]
MFSPSKPQDDQSLGLAVWLIAVRLYHSVQSRQRHNLLPRPL